MNQNSVTTPIDPAVALERALVHAALATGTLGRSNIQGRIEPTDSEIAACSAVLPTWKAVVDAWLDAMQWNAGGNRHRGAYNIQTLEAVCTMVTRVSFATRCQSLFSGLALRKASDRETAIALARARLELGAKADLLDAFFRMALRTFLESSPRETTAPTLDEEHRAFLGNGPHFEVPTLSERELYARASTLLAICGPESCLSWLQAEHSAEARILRAHANFDESDYNPGEAVFVVHPPSAHDWMAVHEAAFQFTRAGLPYHKRRQYRVDWARKLVWLCVAITSTDITWTDLGLSECEERTWIWQLLIEDSKAREVFNDLVRSACQELDRSSAAGMDDSSAAPVPKSAEAASGSGTRATDNPISETPSVSLPWSDEIDRLVLQDGQGEVAAIPRGNLAWAFLVTLQNLATNGPVPIAEVSREVTLVVNGDEFDASQNVGLESCERAHKREWVEGRVVRRGGRTRGVYDGANPLGNLEKFRSALRKHMPNEKGRGRAWRSDWIHVDKEQLTIQFGARVWSPPTS